MCVFVCLACECNSLKKIFIYCYHCHYHCCTLRSFGSKQSDLIIKKKNISLPKQISNFPFFVIVTFRTFWTMWSCTPVYGGECQNSEENTSKELWGLFNITRFHWTNFLYHIIVWSLQCHITQSNPLHLQLQLPHNTEACHRHWQPAPWTLVVLGELTAFWACLLVSPRCPKDSSCRNSSLNF